jgi:thiosulfate reductase cytochrome b subunit
MQYAGVSGKFSLIRFDQAVKFHNIAAIILVIDYGFFVIGNRVTSNGKHYRIKRKGFFKGLRLQFSYYTNGMFKGDKHPFEITPDNKFNPLQKISYVMVIYFFMPLLIISGLALLFPEIIITQVFGISGILLTDLVHVIAGFILSIFMIIHIYTCTLGEKPGTLFRSMMNGYHEVHE